MKKNRNTWLKFTLAFISCLFFRLLPFRPPNIEPILATQMPLSKAYGAYIGFSFAFLSIVLFDLITHRLGMWTLLTGGTYGILGVWAFHFFKKRESNKLNYVYCAIIGTLFFDAVTGLSMGPLFFHQSFVSAFVGQIPFTMWHLIGNISFSFIMSPAIYASVIKNENVEDASVVNLFKVHKI